MSELATSEPVIKVDKLRKAYGRNEVLRGVDIEVPAGAIVGLIGTNGSGKSTLIKCLLGLLRATSGQMRIFGEDVWDLSADAKSRLCYVPQEVKVYPWMRVKHVIDYTSAFYPNWSDDWVKDLVERWELPGNALVSTLSGGQAQKLALVLGLGHRPELMILDEPVASLDPVGRREFLRSVLELTSGDERTVLFSTHITSDLERIASHVAILREGRIAYFDELDVLKDQFKRLRIQSGRELPSSFNVAGSLRTEVQGQTALVAMPHVSEPLIAELESTWDASVHVEDLNLEEIFVELHDA